MLKKRCQYRSSDYAIALLQMVSPAASTLHQIYQHFFRQSSIYKSNGRTDHKGVLVKGLMSLRAISQLEGQVVRSEFSDRTLQVDRPDYRSGALDCRITSEAGFPCAIE
jgi:hypothetical protein